MKHHYTALLALALATLSACKKEKETTYPVYGQWTINETSFTANALARSIASDKFMLNMASTLSAKPATLTFTFSAQPEPGIYRVTDKAIPAYNEVCIGASYYPFPDTVMRVYFATGLDNGRAIVKVNKGKISISMPYAGASSITLADTVGISGVEVTEF